MSEEKAVREQLKEVHAKRARLGFEPIAWNIGSILKLRELAKEEVALCDRLSTIITARRAEAKAS